MHVLQDSAAVHVTAADREHPPPYFAAVCLPMLFGGIAKEVVQLFVQWHLRAGFDRVFAYVEKAADTFDIDGVSWFVSPGSEALGREGRIFYHAQSFVTTHCMHVNRSAASKLRPHGIILQAARLIRFSIHFVCVFPLPLTRFYTLLFRTSLLCCL